MPEKRTLTAPDPLFGLARLLLALARIHHAKTRPILPVQGSPTAKREEEAAGPCRPSGTGRP